MSDDHSEIWDTVARRADLLAELREGPRQKRVLASTLPVSRSTVDRGIADLVDLGLVAVTDGRVRLTVAGDLVAALYHDATASVDELLSLAPSLEGLDECIRPPPSFFGETEVVTADDRAHTPGERLIDAFLDADRCRLVRGAIRPAFSADVRERMVDGSLTIDATLCPDSIAFLRSFHGSDLERVLDLDTVTVREYAEPLHSGLYLFDTDGQSRVWLSVHDEATDDVRALFGSDRPEAVDWADRTLSRIHDRSTRVRTS
ncbi:helix-turn-helix transcriptional regulator [Haloplanus pelagicus]|jgi:predicted transcriptional regulator|uniref:helix-turn-helix transcriptional regulator n=1 Tax=Haloplanus pelagicus TaxID=2949995 RepID=UPI00203D23CD|nr:hypothetical protein [Haloplanus sp. HW8-1]